MPGLSIFAPHFSNINIHPSDELFKLNEIKNFIYNKTNKTTYNTNFDTRLSVQELEKDFPGLKVLTCSVDVTVKTQVDAAFDRIQKTFGPIDVLMSNAGYVPSGADPVSITDVGDSWATFEINVKGAMLVAQAFSRTARESEAVVVDTSSIVAILPPWPSVSGSLCMELSSSMRVLTSCPQPL